MSKNIKFKHYLSEKLKDPKEAAAYLSAAFETNDPDMIVTALCDVIEARGSKKEFAERAKIHRVSLYKILREGGNPELETLLNMMDAMGFNLNVSIKNRMCCEVTF